MWIGRRVIAYLGREISGIRDNGTRGLQILAKDLVIKALLLIPLLIVRAMRPLVLVRFKRLPTSRIGPMASSPEVFLCELEAGYHNSKAIDIYFPDTRIANQQLMVMWGRSIRIYGWARHISRLNRWLPGWKNHEIPWRHMSERDVLGLLSETKPHISFTVEEEAMGLSELRKIGISDDAPIVCFHARDPSYIQEHLPNSSLQLVGYKDSNIANYMPAAEKLAENGYYVLRMGAVVAQPLETGNDRIIDYANVARSDFMDIYLSAKCHFFICSSSGLDRVPMIFRRPSLYVNYLMLELLPTWGPKDLCIPKRIWSKSEGRYLRFKEILDSGIGRWEHKELFDNADLIPEENTPDEILAAVKEMTERLDGTWEDTDEDELLQRNFWSLFRQNDVNGVFLSRVGAEFLRQNQKLLEV